MTSLKYLFDRVTSSSLAQSSGIYTVSGFINAAIPIILLPILTRKLSPADYGVVAMFQIAVNVLYPFIGLNMEGAIGRKFYDKNGSDFPSFVGTCFLLVICSLIIVSILFLILINPIYTITQIPKAWLKYILMVAFCQFITTVVLVNYQVRVQPFKYGFVQITQSILNVVLTILFVVVWNMRWDGRLFAQILTGIVFAIVSSVILLKTRQFNINIKKEDIKYALNFGIPLIPHAIGGMFFVSIDRFFLTKILGLEQTGNFTVAFQIGTIISIMTSAFNNAYVPWLFSSLNKGDLILKMKIVKFTYLYFVILSLGAVILLFSFPTIISILVDKSFTTINVYSTFIVFGFVFQGMYFMVTNYISYAQKTYILAAVTISVALLKLPIAFFSITWFGAMGAAISFCITWLLFFVLTWVLSAKVYSMPWNLNFKTTYLGIFK